MVEIGGWGILPGWLETTDKNVPLQPTFERIFFATEYALGE
jgi:hypothetical protein